MTSPRPGASGLLAERVTSARELRVRNHRSAVWSTTAGILAALVASTTGCGSGRDCLDVLRFDGVVYEELRDDPSFASTSPAPDSLIGADIDALSDIAMVVSATDGCESGSLDDGEATTLPAGTEVFRIPDTDLLVAVVDGAAIVFQPRSGLDF